MLRRAALQSCNLRPSLVLSKHRSQPVFGFRPQQRLGVRCISFQSSLDICYSHTYEALSALHAISGLSWAWTLPVAAVIIRTAFVLPLDLWARKHRLRAIQLRPVLAAWSPIVRDDVKRENRTIPVRAQYKLYLHAMRKKRQELYKRMGINIYPGFAPLLQLPIWLVAIETIRKMCGAREGLLGLVTKNLKDSDTEPHALELAQVSKSVPVETSLGGEGALWFPDLLVPDPQLILPFVLSTTLFSNVWLNQRQQRAEGVTPTKASTRITRVLQVMALGIGPVTLAMPSAMLVYWISSSACAMLQHVVIWKLLPSPPTATPCHGPYGASSSGTGRRTPSGYPSSLIHQN